MSATQIPALDEARVEALMGQFVADLGACLSAATVLVGEKLGLFKALVGAGPVTPAELAEATGTDERYVREWLSSQAASGFVDYDEASERFTLAPEQAAVFADESSATYVPGAFQLAASLFKDEPHITERFRSGGGFGWHEHHEDLFIGTERFFRPGYVANIAEAWIPALDGVREKLEAGALVADLGCGHGASTIILAKAFPKSTFRGFDYHEASIEWARRTAEREGVADRVTFEVAAADSYPGEGYDLACVFDALHDMGDPEGAARHVLSTLAPDGTWMIVEPNAGDHLTDNLNPVGRIFYSASTMICTPAARDQDGEYELGAQAGEARLTNLLQKAGFTRVRRATETPFNMVLEARP
jgi:SAM-dependent methyltransferase